MKLLHTADVHLDRSFASLRMPPRQANWRRQLMRELFLDMLRRAASGGVDAVLVAGDLFEQERVSHETAGFLREAFELARPLPVFITPGAGDPCGPASPYATERWPDNVHVFAKPAWESVRLADIPLTVHGFGFDAPAPSANPWGTLKLPPDGRVHVAVGYGAAVGFSGPGDGEAPAPFTPDEAIPAGLHYLALGHHHSAVAVPNAAGVCAWYAGPPETPGHASAAPAAYLDVTIEGKGATQTVTVTPVRSARTRYLARDIDCSELRHPAQVADAIAGIGRATDGDCVARIRLTGRRPAPAPFDLDTLRADAGAPFVHLELVDETAAPFDHAALAGEHTGVGLFAARLNQELADTVSPERHAMCQRARDLGLEALLGPHAHEGDDAP